MALLPIHMMGSIAGQEGESLTHRSLITNDIICPTTSGATSCNIKQHLVPLLVNIEAVIVSTVSTNAV